VGNRYSFHSTTGVQRLLSGSLEVPMDAYRFDAFTRSLGMGASRRGLTRYLAGLALASVVATDDPLSADAKKHKKKKKGKKKDCAHHCSGGICCDGKCVSVLTDRNNCGACDRLCDQDQTCVNGQCTPCAKPRGVCVSEGKDRCVDLQTDPNNCGSCNIVCPKGKQSSQRDFQCDEGKCVCSGTVCADGSCCPAGFTVCVNGGAGCCPTAYHTCGNGRCCPDGFTCGGNCDNECCPA
jgi:hypothetical protein